MNVEIRKSLRRDYPWEFFIDGEEAGSIEGSTSWNGEREAIAAYYVQIVPPGYATDADAEDVTETFDVRHGGARAARTAALTWARATIQQLWGGRARAMGLGGAQLSPSARAAKIAAAVQYLSTQAAMYEQDGATFARQAATARPGTRSRDKLEEEAANNKALGRDVRRLLTVITRAATKTPHTLPKLMALAIDECHLPPELAVTMPDLFGDDDDDDDI